MKHPVNLSLILLASVALCGIVHGATIYADRTGNTPGSFTNLQAAFDALNLDAGTNTLVIKPGNYEGVTRNFGTNDAPLYVDAERGAYIRGNFQLAYVQAFPVPTAALITGLVLIDNGVVPFVGFSGLLLDRCSSFSEGGSSAGLGVSAYYKTGETFGGLFVFRNCYSAPQGTEHDAFFVAIDCDILYSDAVYVWFVNCTAWTGAGFGFYSAGSANFDMVIKCINNLALGDGNKSVGFLVDATAIMEHNVDCSDSFGPPGSEIQGNVSLSSDTNAVVAWGEAPFRGRILPQGVAWHGGTNGEARLVADGPNTMVGFPPWGWTPPVWPKDINGNPRPKRWQDWSVGCYQGNGPARLRGE